MKKRIFFIALGLLFIAVGASGMVFIHLEQQRHYDQLKLRAEMQATRAEEEKFKAEDIGRQLQEAKEKAQQAQAKLSEEQKQKERQQSALREKLTQERSLRKRLEEERANDQKLLEAQKKSRRETAQTATARRETAQTPAARHKATTGTHGNPEPEIAAASAPAPEQREKGRIKLRFVFNPYLSRELRVAHIHVGDKVNVRITSAAPGSSRLYAGLKELDEYADASFDSPFGGPPVPHPVVMTSLSNVDSFTISPTRKGGTGRSIGSRTGAVLTIGTNSRSGFRFPGREFADAGGFYEIEMTIETGNRWGIQPRSLL